MRAHERWEPGPGIRVIRAEFTTDKWVVTADAGWVSVRLHEIARLSLSLTVYCT